MVWCGVVWCDVMWCDDIQPLLLVLLLERHAGIKIVWLRVKNRPTGGGNVPS